jgi:hypothetical protein
MSRKLLLATVALSLLATLSFSQNSNYRSLLPETIMDEIIGESSGETAMRHIIEMGAYNHNRPLEEYTGNFFETDYIVSMLTKYNLKGVEVSRYPGGMYWDGIRGELWETSPKKSKLADYDDLTAMVAQGSQNTDIIAMLIWVGDGSADEINKRDVKGKIVVTSGSPRMAHTNAVKMGAVGVVSYNSPRPSKVNLAIPVTSISGRGQSGGETFAFMLPPREGELLRDRLIMGEEIEVHAVIESQTVEYDMEVTSCVIEGSNPDAGEVILSAHIFEGYVKQGANDNISGSAAILEVARALQTMIDEKRIERPLRSIRFIWVPEYSGTIPWVGENQDLMKRTLCNINLDMVGLNLAESGSFLTLQRTTYGNAHYINDVMKNYFDYVGITNREGLAISGRGGFTKRVVAPSGTDDPFYYQVDDHYGSSDHEVFNDPSVGVPGIMMITWPDLFYHTSQDRADKCDPTELKRACVIAASGAYTIASAGNSLAMTIGNEIVSNASGRIGLQLARATSLIAEATRDDMERNYNLGRDYIAAAIINEKATLLSVGELSPSISLFLNQGVKLIDEIGKANMAAFDLYMNSYATGKGFKPALIESGTITKRAMSMVPVKTKMVTEGGYGAGRDLGREFQKYVERYPVTQTPDIYEVFRLSNGVNSVDQIRAMLNTQQKSGTIDRESLINTVLILEEIGYLKLK